MRVALIQLAYTDSEPMAERIHRDAVRLAAEA